MSIINKDDYEKISLYQMKWEKQELENIIKEKKNKLEEEMLIKTTGILNSWIAGNDKPSEREIKSLLKDFMQTIKEIEREV